MRNPAKDWEPDARLQPHPDGSVSPELLRLRAERDRLKAENARLRSLAEAWAIEGDYTDGEELHAVLENIITRLQQVATEKTREVGRLRAALSDAVDFVAEGWDPAQPWEYAPRVDRWRELAERKGSDK